jgi:hypothetical protein
MLFAFHSLQDGCITIWSESVSQARISVSQCFKGPVTDLAWTDDGHRYLFSAKDSCTAVDTPALTLMPLIFDRTLPVYLLAAWTALCCS